jgi:hypothetical protein
MEAMQPSLLDIVTRPALRGGVPFQASRTSRKAAEQLAPKVAGRREQVLALFRAGARLTADEAAARLEWKPTQTRPRVCEAAKWGILVDTGKERPSDDGAAMAVYRYATLPELRCSRLCCASRYFILKFQWWHRELFFAVLLLHFYHKCRS